MNNKKKMIFCVILLIVLTGITLNIMTGNHQNLTIHSFFLYISGAKNGWVLMALLCMSGFVLFQAMAIRELCKGFGYKKSFGKCIVYASADVFFSAITPSASGGQPASAYFMMKDKIPPAVTTIILLINLIGYVLAVIITGTLCFIFQPTLIFEYSTISKIMIVIGFFVQFFLLAVFLLMIYKEKIVMGIAEWGLNLLEKLRFVKQSKKRKEKLIKIEQQYKECALAIAGRKKMMIKVLIYNLLQRISIILISVNVFISVGGSLDKILDAFWAQIFVVLGSNSVPVPGAVGAADYLFIDGFGRLVDDSISIEIFSRGISFYSCIIICGFIILAAFLKGNIKERENEDIC